ncbi:MAG: transposase, partial [Frankiales bacterium]|nr:transposase [Frankiales bacterium]
MDAADLYALDPEEFTAARDVAAKAAKSDGDAAAAKALKALRKPSVSAWVVNRLAVEQRDLLDQLLALGPALAQAQSGGRADELRALGRQRRELVEAVTSSAVGAVGRPVSTAVREEVASTLEAALS